MKKFASLLLFSGCLLPALTGRALDLKQSKFTQVVNDVQVISGANKTTRAAALNDFFKMPDVLRTGANSRAELVAEDQTITRVGANTVFSFDAAKRTIDLQKGSLLFHSPKGKGGGTIQTGSATASVLGTTIVVTTTTNGGFKLLVLEGEAEIKFLDGLKQHLSAGQMTFILPGGGLSPIIVFRLDANNKGNQLIHGFDRPLPSSGKLGDAMLRQAKLISRGRAQDTGLLVGDQATATQVEAVDPNSIQHLVNRPAAPAPPPPLFQPSRVGDAYRTIDGWLVAPFDTETTPVSDALLAALALSKDVTINSSALNPHHTFAETGPFRITIPGDPDCSALLPAPASGFFGRNISINTPHIDLSPYYALLSKFDILAAQNLNIAGSLSFDGFVHSLGLTAGGRILIAPGSTLSALTFDLQLKSCGAMRFDRVQILNTVGGIGLSSLADVTLNQGSLTADPGGLPAISAAILRSVELTAGTDVNVAGTHITGSSFTAQAGRSITLNGGATIAAANITLTAGHGILLDNVTMTGDRFTATALDDISAGSAAHTLDLSGFAAVNISGHTLVFENVNFGGDPNLRSDVGQLADRPNTRQRVQPGYVNFVNDVTYNRILITSANQSTYVNPLTGSGIHISPRTP